MSKYVNNFTGDEKRIENKVEEDVKERKKEWRTEKTTKFIEEIRRTRKI